MLPVAVGEQGCVSLRREQEAPDVIQEGCRDQQAGPDGSGDSLSHHGGL